MTKPILASACLQQQRATASRSSRSCSVTFLRRRLDLSMCWSWRLGLGSTRRTWLLGFRKCDLGSPQSTQGMLDRRLRHSSSATFSSQSSRTQSPIQSSSRPSRSMLPRGCGTAGHQCSQPQPASLCSLSHGAFAQVWSAVGEASSNSHPGGRFDLVLAINMTHISPLEATEGLFAGANRLLNRGSGQLVLYGRYLDSLPLTFSGHNHRAVIQCHALQ